MIDLEKLHQDEIYYRGCMNLVVGAIAYAVDDYCTYYKKIDKMIEDQRKMHLKSLVKTFNSKERGRNDKLCTNIKAFRTAKRWIFEDTHLVYETLKEFIVYMGLHLDINYIRRETVRIQKEGRLKELRIMSDIWHK